VKRLAFIAVLFLAAGARPAVRAEEGDAPLDFGGSLRTVGVMAGNYPSEAVFGRDNSWDAASQSLLRLTASGRPAPGLSYEVHGVEGLDYRTAPGGMAESGISPAGTRYRALREEWRQEEKEHFMARFWLDRASVKMSLGLADLTLGRQAVNFSKAWFWNPLDAFLPFDARQFDRDYKPGVDAARLDIQLGRFAGANLVGVAGRKAAVPGPGGDGYADGAGTLGASWYASGAVARVFGSLAGWDLAAQGGKVYGGWQAGTGVAGEVGPLAARGEAAWFRASGGGYEVPGRNGPARLLDDSFTAVAGTGHRFGNSLDLEAEYLYNGAGVPHDTGLSALRVVTGNSPQFGRNLAGVTATYELTGILAGRLSGVANLDDRSFSVQPGVTLSVSDESELLAGAMLNRGRRPAAEEYGTPAPASEFGLYPDQYYAEFKVHF
jgi:hypothetical protein